LAGNERSGIFDALVVGIGGMGSAALYHLASRGLRVLGLERFTIGHDRGSSHGVNRIIRLAYLEHPSYVPLLRRAYALWRELESRAGETLLFITGSLDIGSPGSQTYEGSILSCRLHDLEHEILSAADVNQRFPGYRLPPDVRAVYQRDGGFVLAERSVAAHAAAATALGATIHDGETVLAIDNAGSHVTVRTDRGQYAAERVVVTAGAWAASLLKELAPLAVPERQVLMWTAVSDGSRFHPSSFPVFNLELPFGRFYGFPEFGIPGFKIGKYHHRGEVVAPDAVDRRIDPEDERVIRAAIRSCFPDADGPVVHATTCMFTNSPDEHFIVDTWPADRRVVIAAGFSGHGFKFCPVIGEVLADLATRGATRHDITLFRLARFS
jgi:sarcosine oxidase